MNEAPPIRSLASFDGLSHAERELIISKLIVEVHDWLTGVDEDTPIWELSSTRTYAADIATMVKRLDLSVDLRLDALLVLRLAERAVGKTVRRLQAAGELGTLGTNGSHSTRKVPSPQPYIGYGTTAHTIYKLTDGVSDAQFGAILAAARAEGKLSRNYIARKVVEAQTGKPANVRRSLVDEAREIAEQLRKVTARLNKVRNDDRLERHKADVAARLRYYVTEAETACAALREALDEQEQGRRKKES